MSKMLFGIAIGIASTCFVWRFKDALTIWRKRVETDIEEKLKKG